MPIKLMTNPDSGNGVQPPPPDILRCASNSADCCPYPPIFFLPSSSKLTKLSERIWEADGWPDADLPQSNPLEWAHTQNKKKTFWEFSLHPNRRTRTSSPTNCFSEIVPFKLPLNLHFGGFDGSRGRGRRGRRRLYCVDASSSCLLQFCPPLHQEAQQALEPNGSCHGKRCIDST